VSSHTPAQDTPDGSHTHPHLRIRGKEGFEVTDHHPLTHPHSSLPPRPHPRTRSRQRSVGSLWGRHTGSCLLCSHTGHRRRARGYGHTHPHLGQRGPVRLRNGPRAFLIAILTHSNIPVLSQPPGLCQAVLYSQENKIIPCLPISLSLQLLEWLRLYIPHVAFPLLWVPTNKGRRNGSARILEKGEKTGVSASGLGHCARY
jgi:hypothetical protein